MAHFAQLDENYVVTRVLVIADHDCMDDEGNEDELVGKRFCQRLFGGGNFVQTSYNGNIRKRFAGVGYEYNRDLDAFIPPKTHESFVFDEERCEYVPPVPYPTDGKVYVWDEPSVDWVLMDPQPEG